MKRIIAGRGAYPGVAEGPAVLAPSSVAGWGAVFDLSNGRVMEIGNPAFGQTVRAAVFILNGSRGSTGFATQFHRLRVANVGPCALIIPKIDSRTAASCAVSRVPAVTDLPCDLFAFVRNGDWLRVDGTRGTIEIESRG